jgi:uncharacterized protein (DUF302 family)
MDKLKMEEKKIMNTRRVEIERFSLISSKPFQTVLAALRAAVGHPDLAEFAKAAKDARSFAELEDVVQRQLGETGLMSFLELDHGSILRKETGLDTPRIVRLLIGNPLIMKEMAKHVPDAGSYAPVTILLNERPDGVHLTYDVRRPARILAGKQPVRRRLVPGLWRIPMIRPVSSIGGLRHRRMPQRTIGRREPTIGRAASHACRERIPPIQRVNAL